jgi:hypothetical protein
MIEPPFSGSWKNQTQYFALLKDKKQANSASKKSLKHGPVRQECYPADIIEASHFF